MGILFFARLVLPFLIDALGLGGGFPLRCQVAGKLIAHLPEIGEFLFLLRTAFGDFSWSGRLGGSAVFTFV